MSGAIDTRPVVSGYGTDNVESSVGHGEQTRLPDLGRYSSLVALDPLHEYIRGLSPVLLNPETQLAVPIAGPGSTTFGSRSLAHFAGLKVREASGRMGQNEAEYGRYGTPITRQVEQRLATLDRGEAALVFDSGMAAIASVIDAILPNSADRAHLIVGKEGYRQTQNILDRYVSRGWIELSVIGMDEFNSVGEHLRPNTCGIFFETPSNPYLRVIDVSRVRQQVDQAQSEALVIVDHTFASPINQTPLTQGAHLVVPSLTKYIGGRNEVMAGAVIGSADLVARVAKIRGQLGNILKDADCLKIEAGLETLEGRVHRSNENGMFVAEYLNRNPDVREVWYPGLVSKPENRVASQQMTGFGGVVTFRLKADDFREIEAFTDAFIAAGPEGTFLAPSFGGEAPLISVVTVVSHFAQSMEERAARNIPFDLIRLSVGTVDPRALQSALNAGFEALKKHRGE